MRNPFIYILTIVLFTLVIFTKASAADPQSPSAVNIIDKCAAKINSGKGLSAQFTASDGKHSSAGSIKSQGNKFNINTGGSKIWYNGKDMWVYANNEVTLYNPTQQELLETNPILYVKANTKAYNAIFARVQPAGKYLVVLLPKQKNSEIKRVDITIDKTTMLPEKIEAVNTSNMKAIVSIRSLKLGQVFSNNSFEFPKNNYPGIEINDMR